MTPGNWTEGQSLGIVFKAMARKHLPGIKKIIAVGSGKGGVGKSTISASLCLALQHLGARTALLDADIYGPSQALIMGLRAMPEVKQNKIIPVESHGVPIMSMSFFAPVGDAVIWRGPMVAKAVSQMLFDVDWLGSKSNLERRDIDYLIVDLPPGTGDVHLTIIQSLDLSGGIVVSTPQDLALIDAAKGIAMFQKFKVPILGLVENMSSFLCPHCSKETPIFGQGGVAREAEKNMIPVLAKIPLDLKQREQGDRGIPLILSEPKNPSSLAFIEMAKKIREAV